MIPRSLSMMLYSNINWRLPVSYSRCYHLLLLHYVSHISHWLQFPRPRSVVTSQNDTKRKLVNVPRFLPWFECNFLRTTISTFITFYYGITDISDFTDSTLKSDFVDYDGIALRNYSSAKAKWNLRYECLRLFEVQHGRISSFERRVQFGQDDSVHHQTEWDRFYRGIRCNPKTDRIA